MSPLPRRPRFRRRVAIPVEARDGAGTAAVVAQYGRLNLRLRARMLGRLLQSCGSLAIAVVGGGAFAKYLTQGWPHVQVSVQDAARATSSQVMDVVRYVQQRNPELLERWAADVARLNGRGARMQMALG